MSATFGRRAGAALVLVLALAAGRASAAGPSAADVATARELYKQGADALDAGNAAVAADKLAQAWALVQTPVIGFDLSRAQLALGHLVEAREAALSVQRLPVGHDETARSNEARGAAGKLAAQLESRIPHVTVSVEGLAGHEATVKIDGSVIPGAALSVARQADPGSHVAVVDTDDGRHAEGTVMLAERDTRTIVLRLDAPRATESTTPPAKPAHVETVAPTQLERPAQPALFAPTPEKRPGTSPLVWIGLGTAVAGLVTGAITGAFALSEESTVKANCSTQSSVDQKYVCFPPYTNDLATANTLATISTIGFVVSGVGIAVLVTGLVLGGASTSHAQKTARITPFFGPVTGVRGEF